MSSGELVFFSHCHRAWQLSAVRFSRVAMVFHEGRDLVSSLKRISVRSSAGGHGQFRWSAMAGSKGLGIEWVESGALRRVAGTWPGTVGVGDGALSRKREKEGAT